LKVNEISCVDRGAGEGVKVVLMKRADDDKLIARGREILRRHGINFHNYEEDLDSMTKVDDREEFQQYFERWLASLSPEERAWARRQIDLAEDRMAEHERAGRIRTTPRSAVVTTVPQNQLSAVERDGFGSGAKAKSDTLQKIAADFGIQRLAKHLVEHGSQEITEGEFVELVNKHAGQSAAKLWAGDTEESRVILKAASVLRQAAYAKQAASHMAQARERGLIG
jgi:hypothetical protein